MKIWRAARLILWIVGGIVALLVLLVVGFISYDHLQFRSALRTARSLRDDRLERLVVEARSLQPHEKFDTKYLSTASTPFADIGPKYVIVMPGRVDLVFYKMFEDEVCVQVHPAVPQVELIFLDRDKWIVEQLWPRKMRQNQTPMPTSSSVTPRASARGAPAALAAYL